MPSNGNGHDADYDAQDDLSLDEGYRAIRERKAEGGPGWKPKAVRFGDRVDLPEWLVPEPPPTKFAIHEVERGPSYEESVFDFIKHGDAIFRGTGIETSVQLRVRGLTAPGTKITMKFLTGTTVVYEARRPGDTSRPACIYRFDRAV
jgi:hypothetical protein